MEFGQRMRRILRYLVGFLTLTPLRTKYYICRLEIFLNISHAIYIVMNVQTSFFSKSKHRLSSLVLGMRGSRFRGHLYRTPRSPRPPNRFRSKKALVSCRCADVFPRDHVLVSERSCFAPSKGLNTQFLDTKSLDVICTAGCSPSYRSG